MKQFAIIIPAFKPDDRCIKIVDEIIETGFGHIIVVDDGSGRQYAPIFHLLDRNPEVTVLYHAANQGKGRALKTAFHYILNKELPIKGVITADADGQHLVSDMHKVAERLLEMPDHVVLGVRDFSKKDIPFRSRFGNRCTRLLFRFVTGTQLTDTQTGLRGFPAKHLKTMLEVQGERFEYEMNMLAAFKPANIALTEVPIETVYIDENKSSHFHPLRDSFHVYKVFLKYGLSGAASFGLDIGLFWLFTALWKEDAPGQFIIFATVAARVLSSMFNYYVNRHKVFGQGSRRSIVRYFLLAAVIMLLSAGTVQLLYSEWLGRGEVILKIIVDTFLFLLGFVVQRNWVFKKEQNEAAAPQ